MPKLKVVPGKVMLKWLEKQGFEILRQKGSHAQVINGKLQTTVPLHNRDLPRGTIRQILKDTELTTKQYQDQI